MEGSELALQIISNKWGFVWFCVTRRAKNPENRVTLYVNDPMDQITRIYGKIKTFPFKFYKKVI
jgi:hypothetical protein